MPSASLRRASQWALSKASASARSGSSAAGLLEPGRPWVLMSFGDVVVEFDTDAWLIAHLDAAIADDVALVGNDRRPIVAMEPVVLEHEEVRNGGAHVSGGHGADRGRDVVGGERHVVDL